MYWPHSNTNANSSTKLDQGSVLVIYSHYSIMFYAEIVELSYDVNYTKWSSPGIKHQWNLQVFQKDVPIRLLGTRFKVWNCICEPGPQDPYKDTTL
jgi:hypothetical protein